MTDYSIIFCPSDPDAGEVKAVIERLIELGFAEIAEQMRDYSYMCLGWAMQEDDDWGVWKKTSKDASNSDKILPMTFVTSDIDHAEGHLYRLREGIERFFITDINNPGASALAQSTLVVIWDIIASTAGGAGNQFNHVPGGMNILYMDGHVSFARYPGDFPCDEYLANKLGKGGPTPPTDPVTLQQ